MTTETTTRPDRVGIQLESQDPASTPIAWHTLELDEVSRRLETDPERGLSEEEALRRRERYGPNALTPRAGTPWWMALLLQFHQPLVYILLVATVVSALLGEWIDAAVILGVVLVNAVVGFVQESKAAEAIDALARTMVAEATVIRGGRPRKVSATELVPGDLVRIASGDQVPADLRLVRIRDLRIAEAALTGESVPIEKRQGILEADTPLGDRVNLAFASSLVTFGSGSGLVVATGDHTEVGRISQLMSSAEDLATPLTREIARFSRWLMVVILGLAGIAFVIGLIRGDSAADTFHASVALAVAAIPEGLPAAVTIVLAIGVWRMAKRHAIIRKLPAVEALGSTSVICSDKTGTLTENRMAVVQLKAGDRFYKVEGEGGSAQGAIRPAQDPDEDESSSRDVDPLPPRVIDCLTIGLLCNDSHLVRHADGRLDAQGDPTETALLVAAAKAGLFAEDLQERLPRVDSLPFESEFQYMATLHDQGPGRPRLVLVKGSVEQVTDRCDGIDRDAIQDQAARMALQGQRVLAFARKELPPDRHHLTHEDLRDGLEFVGLQGMIDPPRPEAIQAVADCLRAGIQVKMITGDHAATASAIAGQLGLQGTSGEDGRLRALTGAQLAQLEGEALADAADRVAVFARVTPEQKLRLVQALQSRGRIVAMTGDGVNDAPALKQADIGVAMGLAGTDVAKDAADMILTDDNFASIAAAVEEGRGVFENLTKFIAWTLPTNVGEGLVILAALLIGAVLPILPVQILWINMTTAVLLGMTLTFEPKEPDLMSRPPRDPKSSFLDASLLRRIVIVGVVMLIGAFGLFKWEILRTGDEVRARTVAVNVFVFVEIFYLFASRTLRRPLWKVPFFSNHWLLVGVVVMVALQLLLTYTAPFQTAFHTGPIDLTDWTAVLLVSAIALMLVELEKTFTRYREAVARPHP